MSPLLPLLAEERASLQTLSGHHKDVFTERRRELQTAAGASTLLASAGRAARALAGRDEIHHARSLASEAAPGVEEELAREWAASRTRAERLGLAPLGGLAWHRRVRVATTAGAHEREERGVALTLLAGGQRVERLAASSAALTLDDLELPARAARPYRGPVLLLPRAAGALLHELVGHNAECGLSGEAPRRLGEAIGPADLAVADQPDPAGFDDEGTEQRPAELVESGRLIGALGDARSLQRVASATPRARRASFREAPLPRHFHLRIAAGGTSHGDLSASQEIRRFQWGELSTDGRSARLGAHVVWVDGEPVGPVEVVVALEALLAARLGSEIGSEPMARCRRDGQEVLVSWSAPAIWIEATVRPA